MIMGSNMAECHPIAFRWAMKAKEKGATLIHVDPRFTRTSAMANIHAPIRAGTDIAFLGGLINYIINSQKWNEDPFYKEYVVNYTNAASLVSADYKDTEDMDGVFAGLDTNAKKYDIKAWAYQRTGPAPQPTGQEKTYTEMVAARVAKPA